MGFDHSNAFVRLTFDGLIAFCFNPQAGDRCEAGMVQVPHHEPLLTITRINPNGTPTVLKTERLKPQDDVSVVAENPVQTGTSRFEPQGFNREDDVGDEEDFRWIIDLEHPHEFHGRELLPVGGGSDTFLRPKIVIPHGVFYTCDKSADVYFRTTLEGSGGPDRALGKIADKVGADIVCGPEGGRVTVTIGRQEPFTLRRDDDAGTGFRYRIDISNLCRTSGGPACGPDESDFPQYYKALRDPQTKRFDLRVGYPTGDPRGKRPVEDSIEKLSARFSGFRFNGPPQVCNSIYLSKTDTIV